ncbi:hypothetical protein H0X10_00465 [Candidatus Saccharibacteria bacterium]|nr:hypothetical protein [Candidatus Saccharibacteria bacterium]
MFKKILASADMSYEEFLIPLLLPIIVIFIVIIVTEALWRAKILRNEPARKLVHILVGTFVASWAFFLDDKSIVLLAVAMFAVVLISRTFGIFRSIHSVTRKTWGELFFPLGIVACALLTDSPWIFAAAMLHVSIADGLAAVVGVKYHRKYGYKVFHQQKTSVGTLTFFNASLFITLATVLLAPELQGNLLIIVLVPLASTLAENLTPYGADDLLVPLTVTGLLLSL